MLLLIVVVAIPLIVFFSVFFFLRHKFKQGLPNNSESIPSGYYALAFLCASVLAFLVFLGTYALAYKLEPYLYLSEIQTALNEQCGDGKYMADARGYNGDPGQDWVGYQSEVFCRNESGEGWRCICPVTNETE